MNLRNRHGLFNHDPYALRVYYDEGKNYFALPPSRYCDVTSRERDGMILDENVCSSQDGVVMRPYIRSFLSLY